jgi:lysophospholipase L1-like esterase
VVDEHNPRLVIVWLGGNDMLRQVRDTEITQNLRSIIKTL